MLRVKNKLVKLLFPIGKLFWRPGYVRLGAGKVYLHPREGMSTWKRKFDVWEYEYFENLKKYIKPGELILEFGSCFGDTALKLLGMAGENGKVVSIEPFPRYFAYLEKTMAANPDLSDRLKFLNIGYATKPGVVSFETEEETPYAKLGIKTENSLQQSKSTSKQKVAMHNLREIIDLCGFNPTLLYMDIEGVEQHVLSEMMKLKLTPNLAWEEHSAFYGAEKLATLLQQLREYGYTHHQLDPHHYFSEFVSRKR